LLHTWTEWVIAALPALAFALPAIRPGPTVEFPDDPLPTTATWNLDNLGNWSGDEVNHESVVRTGDFDADGDVDPLPPDTTSLHHAVDAANVPTALFTNGTAPTTFATDPAENLVCDGPYVYLYDGLNRLVQVNERGNAVFDQPSGRFVTGELGDLVFRHVYDGLGRVIRKEQTESAFTLPRTEDYYYDGIRRIQDVIRRPVAAPPPEPCDDVGFSKSGAIVAAAGLEDEVLQPPGWMDELGTPIGPELPPCDSLEPANKTSGETYETWTDREYVYHAADGAALDEFILQIDRTGTPIYVIQDADLNVVGLFGVIGGSTQMLRQDVYTPYGEVAAMDYFSQSIADNKVGHKGMFFDRLGPNPLEAQLQPGAAGLYRYRNRTYSPTLGRFLQRDPNATAMPLLL